jgi:hypothetical protein
MDAQFGEMPQYSAKYLQRQRDRRFNTVKSYVNSLRTSATKYCNENHQNEWENIIKYVKFLACVNTQVSCDDTSTTIRDYIAETLLNFNREFGLKIAEIYEAKQ